MPLFALLFGAVGVGFLVVGVEGVVGDALILFGFALVVAPACFFLFAPVHLLHFLLGHGLERSNTLKVGRGAVLAARMKQAAADRFGQQRLPAVSL